MWQLEQYEQHQRKGLAAIEEKDWRLGRFHLLKAGEYLLKAAKHSGPDFRAQRQTQAQKLMSLARQCEARLRQEGGGEPLADDEAAEGASGGSPDYSGGAPAAGGGGKSSSDKHLTDFRPMPTSNLKMSDVVGLDEVKRQVRLKAIYPLEHPELIKQYRGASGGGILLYGPPGTGKTMIARAIAAEVDAPFYNVKPSDILAPLVGVAERNVERLFATLKSTPRAVVFFDELDALLPSRDSGSDSNVMGRLVPQFLQEMQGVSDSNEAAGKANAEAGEDGEAKEPEPSFRLLLGATNTPWSIDPAVLRPGRFDELIYIPLPDLPARRLLFEKYGGDRPLEDGIDFQKLAEMSDGFSAADIRDLCDDTAERVLERAIEAGEVLPLSQADFEATISEGRKSVTQSMLDRYRDFAAEQKA
jgi:SpoVK/Ycf46/Vps4 family AAA+-type ATPase